ncbi:unnamed protein product [marine sediment metagenome]|uniref:Uncharacterized protein n=1 Tax=marine sediment metagenome TaxID=412755 RepID=X0T4X2_9ZZZZ
MADSIKKNMHKRAGIGGLKCRCCNSYKGKGRKALVRAARRTAKQKTGDENNG